MKRLEAGILGIVLAVLLTGCKGESDSKAETSLTANQMVECIADTQKNMPEMDGFTIKSDDYKEEMALLYGSLENQELTDMACLYSTGATAQEITVIKTEDTDKAEEIFQKRIKERTGNFTGYMPEQAAILEKGKVVVKGNYVALIVCEDMDSAKTAFENCFDEDQISKISADYNEGEPTDISTVSPEVTDSPNISETETPQPTTTTAPIVSPEPGKEMSDLSELEQPFMVVYDNTRIVEAYKNGDVSKLTDEKEKQVYDKAVKIIEKVIKEDMTEYQKELAIHDYLALHVEYDYTTLKTGGAPSKESNTPYGGLIKGKVICIGYANTFQLFMDMLGIQSKVVLGKAFGYAEYHAWNMVCLDGEWYCVDLTWDDQAYNNKDDIMHEYFNCTSALMDETDHQWNEEEYPKAEGTKYAYKEEQ